MRPTTDGLQPLVDVTGTGTLAERGCRDLGDRDRLSDHAGHGSIKGAFVGRRHRRAPITLAIRPHTIRTANQSRPQIGRAGGLGRRTPMTFTLDDFVHVEVSEQPSYDSTGARVAFRSNRSGVSQAWLVSASGGEPQALTDTGGVIYQVAFRPGHDQLLYVADDGGDEQYQLHLLDLGSNTSRALASMPHVIHNFGAWSADGRLLSYGSNRRDRAFFDIYVLDVESGTERLVFQQDGMNAAVAFSADGKSLLITRPNLEVPADSTLWLLDLDGREAPRLLTEHDDLSEWTDAYFHTGGAVLVLSDDGREFTGLQRIDLDTLEREFLLTPEWGLEALALTPDGSRLAVVVNEAGYGRIEAYEVTAEARLGRRLTIDQPSGGVASTLAWRPDGRSLAFTFEGPRNVPDVWVADTDAGGVARLTSSRTQGLPLESLPEPRLVHYTSFDGREIPAYYYVPSDTPRDGSIGCVVLVHGGPEMQSRPALWGRYPGPHYLLARGDVALLVPNVRGSSGYGKEYSHADDVEKRMDSVRDLLAATDWLAASGEVDPQRIAVMGGSYGGFMVLAAITEAPERWAAAIDLYGIANFETFLTHTGAWRRKHRSREYGEDPEFLRSISPIHKAHLIRTPLLVFQGDHDVRVPPEESEQIVETVRRSEGIVEYVVYPEEGHGFQKLPHRMDLAKRVVDFVGEHLHPSGTARVDR
ncbi:MAG: S9 family peptidase [Dehalococcoidia bacterium]|nr:MAG: S9 family peptidase [Dehalococcoidia bacterium]